MHALVFSLFAVAPLVLGDGVDTLPHWIVLIRGCDSQGACGQYRQPIDANNEMACPTTSFKSANRWTLDHPGFLLKAFDCVNISEWPM